MLKNFTFYWLDGKRAVFEGLSPADAFTRAGYGQGASPALDFWDVGDTHNYEWNSKNRSWDKIKEV